MNHHSRRTTGTLLVTIMALAALLAQDREFRDDADVYSIRVETLLRDVGTAAILRPTGKTATGFPIVPRAQVVNYGEVAETFPVRMSIGGMYEAETTASVAAGETTVVSFPPWVPMDSGRYVVSCSTMLDLDERPGNDRLLDSVEAAEGTTVPAHVIGTACNWDWEFWKEPGNLEPFGWFYHGYLSFALTSVPTDARIDWAGLRYHLWWHQGLPTTTIVLIECDPVETEPEPLWWALYEGRPLGDTLQDNLGWVHRNLVKAHRLLETLPADTISLGIRCHSGHGDASDDSTPELVLLYSMVQRDAGVIRLLSPFGRIDSGAVVVPRAVVANRGLEPQTVPVRFSIGTRYLSDTTLFLDGGERDTVSFPPWMVAELGTLAVRCSTMLSGDERPGNDCVVCTVEVHRADAGCSAILTPRGFGVVGDTFVPSARVHNYGTHPWTLPIRFTIGEAYSNDTSVLLDGGRACTVNFRKWVPDSLGRFVAKCSTMLPEDYNPDNNAAAIPVRVLETHPDSVFLIAQIQPFWTGSQKRWYGGAIGPKEDGDIVMYDRNSLSYGWAKFDLNPLRFGSEILFCELCFFLLPDSDLTSIRVANIRVDPVVADSEELYLAHLGSRSVSPGVDCPRAGWNGTIFTPEGDSALQGDIGRGWFVTGFDVSSWPAGLIYGRSSPNRPYLKVDYVEPSGVIDVAVLCDSESVRYPAVAGDTNVLSGFLLNTGDSAATDVDVIALLDLLTPLDSARVPEVRPGDTIPVEMYFLVPPLQGYQMHLFSLAACACDDNPYNDTATVSALVFPTGTYWIEDFEDTLFPPSGWVAVNNDRGSQTWKRDSTASHTGRSCASSAVEWVVGGMDDWLFTDAAVPSALTGDTVGFVCRADSGLLYEVWTMDRQDPDNRLERLYASDTAGHDWQVVWRSLDTHDGDTIYIGFRHRTNRAIHGSFMLDDVYFQGAGRPGIAKEKGLLPGRIQAELVPSVAAGRRCRLCYVMPAAQTCCLTFYDVAGRVAETRELALPAHRGVVPLDLRHLSAGVYVVKLEAEGFAATQKVVIQR
ncbi:MAG: T9SS type A sorting domain-containing protein [candidate division WOR-3 bacterium]|nr:MAG: T9SS type A sorting domain-containing protein [candidate division WOR-3 bacterium]